MKTLETFDREYLRLTNNILALNADGAIKTIMVSSSVPGEGSSTVAINLAATMAKNSGLKVLLVDADMMRPVIGKAFNMNGSKGLSDLVLGQAKYSEILKESGTENLSLIISGTAIGNPSIIFDTKIFKAFVGKLKESFHYVIFDAPSINMYPYVSVLSSDVDAVLMVVQAGKTRWEVVRKAKEQLEMAKAKILGVVLNRVKHVIPGFIYKRL